jgi:pyridoxamine 5'-phosphate oxidase
MALVSGHDLFAPAADAGVFCDPLPENPLPLLNAWLEEAREAAQSPNPDAMSLATIDEDGVPSSRIVLCKRFDLVSGFLVFYTNYDSRKARHLSRNPAAAATFHWDHAGRQARVRGLVVRSPAGESDEYFASRPLLSQLGAWASRQSEPLACREELIGQVAATMMRFGINIEQMIAGEPLEPGCTIPRPPNWGGYRLWIRSVELWSGGPGRLHERALWTRDLLLEDTHHADSAGAWRSTRLQP